MFNAVFFAGLQVTERTNHSLYISHYPKGRDATVSWGGPALRWVNDTPNWVLIRAAYSDSSLTFVIYGTPQGRKVAYTTTDWYDIEPVVDKKTEVTTLPAGKTDVKDSGADGTLGDGQTYRDPRRQGHPSRHVRQPLPDVPAADRRGQGHDHDDQAVDHDHDRTHDDHHQAAHDDHHSSALGPRFGTTLRRPSGLGCRLRKRAQVSRAGRR